MIVQNLDNLSFNMSDLNKIAKEVIEKNQYLALSTVRDDGKPWTCILAYIFDDDYNFYYVSLPTSEHSKHIEKSKSVSFAIYDSTQGFGLGAGLQVEGEAEKLSKDQIPEISKMYFERKYPYGNISNDFTVGLKKMIENGTYFFYKLVPIHIWINDPNADTDRRVEVFLK